MEGIGEHAKPLLATISEATRELRLSRSAFYEAIGRGEVSVTRFGKAIRISWAEIERLSREGFGLSDGART